MANQKVHGRGKGCNDKDVEGEHDAVGASGEAGGAGEIFLPIELGFRNGGVDSTLASRAGIFFAGVRTGICCWLGFAIPNSMGLAL